MNYVISSRLGRQLYELLPEIYRTRDRQQDPGKSAVVEQSLARYLDAHGQLLDLIHATLEQQLKDTLPETSQEWLLPYFARLVATSILSPDAAGKHAEVSRAIAWRQRKGTLKCAEEIAEAVGRMDAELQEGWQRVAVTARIGLPLPPCRAVDATCDLDMSFPAEAARHPALPAATVDLRAPSRAVAAAGTNPAAKSTAFGGVRQSWRQALGHGAPCFPESFEDVSRRTVDIRPADAGRGRYHPKQLLVFVPPALGFFPLKSIPMTWEQRLTSLYEHLIAETVESGVTVLRNRTQRVIEITNNVSLEARAWRIEGIHFQKELKVVAGGRLELASVEAGRVVVDTPATHEAVLTAQHCLFGEVSSPGLVQLTGCTVVDVAYLSAIEVRDSILMNLDGSGITGSIEYSRIPAYTPLSTDPDKLSIKSHHPAGDTLPVTDDPRFVTGQSTLAAKSVLSPASPASIHAGASDHGEMGYHHGGREQCPVTLSGDLSLSIPADGGYPLTDVIFTGKVSASGGPFTLRRAAALALTVTADLSGNSAGEVAPALCAADCLFDSLSVEKALARLEYCTVMKEARCLHLQASDSIFAGTITFVEKQDIHSSLKPFLNCLRYSAIPDLDADRLRAFRLKDGLNWKLGTNTLARPSFGEFHYCGDPHSDGPLQPRKAKFGDWGYGVLGPYTPGPVRFGAEDGGEMGAYHHRYYVLKAKAMIDKMREFLPVGIDPVLIEDERLLHVPPEQVGA